MRTFEEDFEFNFDENIRVSKPQGRRIDTYKTSKFLPNRDDDVQYQARIVAHTERVQRELRESGILDKRSHL